MAQYSPVQQHTLDPNFQQTGFPNITKPNETINIEEKSISSNSRSDSTTTPPNGHSPWKSGIWARLPVLAFLALLITLGLAAMMTAVLAYSNTRPATWSVSPSVLLAIAAALANLCLSFALGEGVILSWWTKALKPDTKLKDLHNNWSFGSNLMDALLAGRAFNLVALASIVVSLAPINGILLQRASSIEATVHTTPFTAQIPLAQEFPAGFTGRVTTRGAQIDVLSSNFSAIVNQYTRGVPHNLTSETCSGQCSGTLQSAGYAISCDKHDQPFDMSPAANGGSGNIDGPYFFYTSFNFSRDTTESLNFTSVFKNANDCAGVVHVANCTLLPAIIKQHVILTNKTIKLDPTYDYTSDKVIRLTPSDSTGFTSTHGGMFLFLSTRFNSKVETRFDGIYGLEVFRPTGSSQLEYMVEGHDTATRGCAMSWSDPTTDMLQTARELAFRISLQTANTSDATNMQAMHGAVQEQVVLVYTTKYIFLGLALLFTFLGILCIIPTFTGWWKLGRNVTMSPLEIAKAFDAKALAGADSNAEVGKLLREVGERKVQYGVLVADHTRMPNREDGEDTRQGVLMLGSPGEVSVPR